MFDSSRRGNGPSWMWYIKNKQDQNCFQGFFFAQLTEMHQMIVLVIFSPN